MTVWERERIRALAPDPGSLSVGVQLAVPGRWTCLGQTAEALWGRCQGSGRTPYESVVDLSRERRFSCSCPSRKAPCKHVLGLLLLWSAGAVPAADSEADFTTAWLQDRGAAPREVSPGRSGVVDPQAAAQRAAARVERVDAGLDDLDRWLRDQVRGGLAGLERAGYAHFDRVAARMIDAQAPGVASMLRSVPVELAGEGWPARVLERLGALHLLVQAHRGLHRLPEELAANVRSRVGYPVTKAEVLARPGVGDRWVALGSVDSVEAQLETRRVWLHGTTTGRWALWLAFAPPGMTLDGSVRAGQVFEGLLHFYPGSGFRAQVGEPWEVTEGVPPLPGESFEQLERRFAELVAADPWATRLPAVVAAAPVPPSTVGGAWRLRDERGRCVELAGLPDDPWLLLARSGGAPVDVFGEWSPPHFRPLSVLPDRLGSPYSTVLG
jgi:hypothetical protein